MSLSPDSIAENIIPQQKSEAPTYSPVNIEEIKGLSWPQLAKFPLQTRDRAMAEKIQTLSNSDVALLKAKLDDNIINTYPELERSFYFTLKKKLLSRSLTTPKREPTEVPNNERGPQKPVAKFIFPRTLDGESAFKLAVQKSDRILAALGASGIDVAGIKASTDTGTRTLTLEAAPGKTIPSEVVDRFESSLNIPNTA